MVPGSDRLWESETCVVDETGQRRLQRGREPHPAVDRHVLLAPFDMTGKIAMHIGDFGETLLRPAQFLSASADGEAEQILVVKLLERGRSRPTDIRAIRVCALNPHFRALAHLEFRPVVKIQRFRFFEWT